MSGAVWQRQQFYLLYNTKSSKNTGDHSPLGRIPKREPVWLLENRILFFLSLYLSLSVLTAIFQVSLY